ncbi:MAG: glycosyltransferase [bacterium]
MALLISIVICTHNRAPLLKGTLLSFTAQDVSKDDFEIVVVDDGSTDGTAAVVQEISSPVSIRYFRQEHGGRSAARNRGIREARGDIVLFVDDDTLAPPVFLSEHLRFHKCHPRSVVRGPIVNITEYRIPETYVLGLRDFSSAFFCTCNASVERRHLEAIGGFDENFKEYGFEDNEIGWRLRQAGLKMKFNKRAIIYHYKPAISAEGLEALRLQAEEMGRSAVAYYRKHPSLRVALATGIFPPQRLIGYISSPPWRLDSYTRQFQDPGCDAARRTILAGKISRCYYFMTMAETLRKV